MAPASKRAAPAAPRGRPPKAAKVAEKPQKKAPAAPVESPAARAVAALLEHLGGCSAPFPSSVIETFRASLPHCMDVPKDERHPFERSVVQSFQELLAEADSQHVQAFDEAKAAVIAHEEYKASAGTKTEEAKAVEESKRREKESAEAASKAAKAASEAAAAAAEAAKQSLKEAEAASQAAEAEKEKYEETLKLWEPLKNFEFKEWRERKKATEQITGLIRLASKSASLADALPTALKEKCESRGSFTQQVVAHAEAALTGHVAVLTARIEECRAAAAAEREAAAKADSALEEATAKLTVAEEASIEAQNAWVDAQNEWYMLKTQNFENKDAEVAEAMKEASSELEALRALVGEFQAIDSPPPAPAPTSEEAQEGAEEVAAEGMGDVEAKVASIEAPASANVEALGA